MGDENPICTLGDYSRLSHEGYRNTIELPEGNNVIPLRSDTIRERTCMRLFQFSLRDQASNWLERLPAGSISTWEDLTTRCSNNIMKNLYRKHVLVSRTYSKKSLIMASIFGSKSKSFMTMSIPSQDEPLTNRPVNDPRDFAKPVKAIALPQDVLSTSDRRLIELENQVQRLMEAHLDLTQPTQVNKITTPCEICSGPHDTQCCMENPKQAFVKYASSFTDETGGKWYTFKPEQNNPGDTYNPSWGSHPNLRWRQPQNSQNNLSNPPNWFQPNGSIPNHPFNNRPQNFKNQSNIEGLVSEFMASQNARLSKFEADFKQQQSEMTNKINTVLKAITDRITSTLPSDMVKNPKLGTHPVLSAQDDDEVMFIEIIRDEEPQNKDPHEVEGATTKEPVVEYFDTIPTRDELTYHRKLNPMEDANGGIRNFTGRIKGMHVFVGNITYVIDFIIIKDISSILDPRLLQVVLGRPFIEISNMTHDPPEGVVRFIRGTDEVAYKMPHKIEQYDSLLDLEKEHTKLVYLRNEEDKRRGVEYVMIKILGFHKECLELGPEYLTGVDDEGEVT
ncbi:hypothetical protein Tco_0472189 [Tanacetum coccineum]